MTKVLIGFKNSGKTVCGRLLAQKTGHRFIDTDDLIIAAHSGEETLDLPAIYNDLGESAFRDLEEKVIRTLALGQTQVIATGGGAVLSEANVRELKKRGLLFYLKVPKSMLFSRLMAAPNLPAFIDKDDPGGSFNDYFEAREGIYGGIANHTLDLAEKSVLETVQELLKFQEK